MRGKTIVGILLVVSLTLNVLFFGERFLRPRAIGAEWHWPRAVKAAAESLGINHYWYVDTCYVSSYSKNIYVETSETIEMSEFKEHLTCTPDVDFTISSNYEGFTLEGDFRPGTSYTLRLDKETVSVKGNRLARDAVFTVKIPDLRQHVDFLTTGPYYQPDGEHLILPLRAVNANDFTVEISEYYPNNLRAFGSEIDYLSSRSKTLVSKKISIPGVCVKNEERHFPLDLTELLGSNRKGLFHVTVRTDTPNEHYYWDYPSREVIVSDLGLQWVWNEQRREATVIVRSLADGHPVANAEIHAFSRKNQEILNGFTSEDGILKTQYLPAYEDRADSPAVMVVKTADDLTFCRLDNTHDLSRFDQQSKTFKSGPQAFVYTNRGICRPGETMTVSAFLRQHDSLAPLANAPCRLLLRDPKGNLIRQETLPSNDWGFLTSDFTIAASALTGYYQAECLTGDGQFAGEVSFLVSAYMPDRIKVKLLPSAEIITAEESVTFTVKADYYFGVPVDLGKASFLLYGETATPPAWWDGYSAGDDSGCNFSNKIQDNGKLDNGEATFEFTNFASLYPSFAPIRLIAQGQAREEGGRPVTAVASVLCHPSPFYLGAKYQDQQLLLRILGQNQDAELPALPLTIKLDLLKHEWNYVLTRNGDNYNYHWQETSQKVGFLDEVTLNSADGKLNLGNLPSGRYELIMTCGDKVRTKYLFWHSAGESGARSTNPSVLSVLTDKETYLLGETATLTVDSPADGFAFIVTGENTIQDAFSVPVKAGANQLTVPIPAELQTEKFNAGLTLVCPGHKLQRSFALVCLKINLKQKQLQIDLENQELSAPGHQLPITVRLTAADSQQPVAGAVHVFAVDEGILSLTNFKTPDIFHGFHGPRHCPFEFSDIYSQIFPRLTLDCDGKFGGDGGIDAASDKLMEFEFEAPACFNLGLLGVPASGVLQTTVTMPEHQGALRLMAVAVAEKRCGSGQGNVILRRPMTISANAPRAVAPQDEFTISFNLFNHDLPTAQASFQATLPVQLQAIDNTDSWQGELVQGKTTQVTLKARALATGRQDIPYSLSLGQETVQGKITMYVRHANPPLTTASYAILKPGETITLGQDDDTEWLPDTLEQTLGLAPSPAQALFSSLGWLNEYPYGCLEQTTSRAFPFLCAPLLAKLGVIPQDQANTAAERCLIAAERLMTMHLRDGCFAMWPGSHEPWIDGSVYAMHFLLWANDLKLVDLDESFRKRMGYTLEDLFDSTNMPRASRGYRLLVYSYANPGRACRLARKFLRENEDCDDLGAFFACLALVKGGQAAAAVSRLQEILQKDVWLENGVPMDMSDLSSRQGMCLALLSELIPDCEATHRLATALLKQLRPDGSAWGTTQGNAWASLGLAIYANAMNLTEATATLTIGDTPTQTLDKLTSAKEIKLDKPATLTNTGKGNLFYSVRSHGIPKQVKSSGNWQIKRIYLDLDGNPITTVKQGDLVQVRLIISTASSWRNIVLCDLLPGGLEIEDSRLATRTAILPKLAKVDTGSLVPVSIEKRDDRFLLFGNISTATEDGVFTYLARAVSKGKFTIPPFLAEAMYSPEDHGLFVTTQTLTIE